MIKTTYKTVLPCEVEDYVKRGEKVFMTDKKYQHSDLVQTLSYDCVIDAINDKTDRFYFWIVKEDKTDEAKRGGLQQ